MSSTGNDKTYEIVWHCKNEANKAMKKVLMPGYFTADKSSQLLNLEFYKTIFGRARRRGRHNHQMFTWPALFIRLVMIDRI